MRRPISTITKVFGPHIGHDSGIAWGLRYPFHHVAEGFLLPSREHGLFYLIVLSCKLPSSLDMQFLLEVMGIALQGIPMLEILHFDHGRQFFSSCFVAILQAMGTESILQARKRGYKH